MRNFWITANIDGRQTMLAGGPRAKDGGMEVEVRQRDEGVSVEAFSITCYMTCKGELCTVVRDNKGSEVARFSTKR